MNKKVIVIGAGYWGKNHINVLKSLNSLHGIVESNSSVLASYLKKIPNIKGYLTIDDSLNDDCQGYIIATPANTHFLIAKKLITSGKHVLIEKPMCFSVEEAEELVFLSEKYKVNVMVGHVLLFHPAIVKIKKIIQEGEIGDLQYIYSNRLNLGKVRSEENVFWSLAPHDIAIFQYITDSKPSIVKSSGSTFLQKGVPDSTITQIVYENGIEGHIFVSWLHPFKEHRLVVIGSEAMISFEDSIKDRPLKLYSKKFDLVEGSIEKFDGPVKQISYEKKMPLTSEVKYFLDHLGGVKLDFCDVRHGLDVVKILSEASSQLLT